MTLEKITVDEETDVLTIYVIPYETVPLQKGYYHGLHVLLHFNKKDGIDRKEDHEDTDPDTEEEEMEYLRLNYKRQRHWSMVLDGNYGGVDIQK